MVFALASASAAVFTAAAPTLFGLTWPVNIGFLIGVAELIFAALILRRWRRRA